MESSYTKVPNVSGITMEDAIGILTNAADSKMNLTDAIVEKFISKGMAVEHMK